MHKKIAKAITSGLMGLSVAATGLAALVPMSASAGNCLGQNDFDDGVGLPWHVCVTNPAEQSFNISGGTYNCTIVNPGGEKRGGDSRWDCQFRHRGLHIESGHTYKLHWEVNASDSGELHTHIGPLSGDGGVWQNNSEDWNQGWNNVKISSGKNSFDCTFTAKETLEVAEWAFHYGGAGPFQDSDCFPEGTTLKFDNMELECTTCGDSFESASSTPCLWDPTNELGVITPRSDVRINQVGYFTNADKKATYATSTEKSAVSFKVLKNGTAVYTGTGKVVGYDKDAGDYCQILDFSEVTEPGTYTIEVDDTSNTYLNEKTKETYKKYISHEFKIGDDVYDGILTDAMNYYYQNRSGMDIEEEYVTSYNPKDSKSKLAHKGGHAPSDKAYVQSEWVKSYGQEFDGDTGYSVDCVGGWYDAGDHGKYVVNGGISVWTLQNMYERSKVMGTDAKWNDGKSVKIPQKYSVGNISFDGTGSPDVLDEARVELEWMFNMIVSSKDTYWGKDCEGMVYHKMHDHKWTGLATKPFDYESEWGTTRIVKPPTYAATFNMIACAAQASRLWEDYDSAFAKTCLDNAKKSWDALMAVKSKWEVKEGSWKTDPQFAPLDQAIGGGGYGDTYVEDDAYWAACELYATTGDSEYYDYLSKYKNKNDGDGHDKAFDITTSLGGGENNGSFSSFNWGCTAGLGTLSLYLSDKTSAGDKADIAANIETAAKTYVDFENKSTNGMGIPYVGTQFTDDINAPGVVIEGYEWGSNSFVINNAIVMAYAYDITKDMSYANGTVSALDYIFGRNGLGFSYVTGYGTYHSNNPHHRYWSYELDHDFPMAPSGVMSGGCGAGLQDPYVGGLGYQRGEVASQKCFVDSIEAWSVNEVTINWNAPFAWAMAFFEDEAADFGSSTPGSTTTTTATTTTTTTTTSKVTTSNNGETPSVTEWGDANGDGDVDMADVVTIMQSLANPNKYGLTGTDPSHLTEQGAVNGDVDKSSVGITSNDAVRIQEYLLKKITSLDPTK